MRGELPGCRKQSSGGGWGNVRGMDGRRGKAARCAALCAIVFPRPLPGHSAPCAAAGLRDVGQADADGGEPEPANRAKNAPLRAWNVRGIQSPARPLCAPSAPPKSPFPAGLADAPHPAPDIPPPDAAATAAETATIRPVHFFPLTRKQQCKSPLSPFS